MATLVQAVATCGPKLVYGPVVEMEELAEWAANRNGLAEEDLVRAIQVVRSAVLHYARHGSPVRIEGLGRFRPTIGRDGKVRLNITPDLSTVKALNSQGGYRGQILNRKRIGLDDAGFKALWDKEHPDDPMEEVRRRGS